MTAGGGGGEGEARTPREMEAEGDSCNSVGEQPQVLPGPGITDSRGTKNPRRDQALLRELRKEEKELKDEEGELMKEREQMESTDMPEEHQRLDLSSPDCSSIKQSQNLLDRIERNAQRQLAVTDEIRRLSEQMRAVKGRSLTDIGGEQKIETAALDERDPANGGELKLETAALNGHEADGGAANGGEQKMETDALDEHGDAANGGEQRMETAASDEHYVDGGGDEEQMDCEISSMAEQVPRIDSKSTSEAEAEAEAATGPDTNVSMIESNFSVSDKSIPKPADHVPINRGDEVVEKMDRDKSAEQLLIEAEKMAAEQKEFAQYVDAWDNKWGSNGFGLFQYMTTVSSMQYTHLIPGSTPRHYCRVTPSLQIVSIKLAEIQGGLEWPLPVYGMIAVRDHVDHNRNLLFACYRSRCQILKEEDPFLALTGPSRAIVCEESVVFEIQLKVRGRTESEDRALITGVCTYNRGDSTVCFRNCFCTAEFRLEVLQETVQATVLGVRVKDGSWPSGWGGRVACSVIDGEIDATPGELELLVSRASAMPVTSEGYLLLSRNVVSVDVNRHLNFLLEACLPSGDIIAQKELSFKPKLCNISQDSCELHGIELEITVAWSSLVSEKRDISVQGCVGDEEQMDWDIASMEQQVPRIDSKLTSEVGPEAETESVTGLDTSESANESNTSMFVSDKSILEPADSVATNTGYDIEKMDRGKSDEQLKIEAKEMAAEQKSFAMYVDAWEGSWGYDGFGCFRDMTTVSSMQYTHLIPGSIPLHYGRVAPSLQIFSVKLAEIRGGLEWPLPVYGTVAARDHVDHNRNLLFARNRSECQILSEEDSFLTLTGPSRAIVSEESVVFEIQLKVRGRTKSQDKPLINGVCTYNRGEGPICFRNCFCTIELTLEVLQKTVQATILGVRVKEGSWPKGFGGRVACSVVGPDARPQEVELLGSRYRPMPVTSQGYLVLSRNVVSVDFCGSLNFVLEAYSDSGDKVAQKNESFEPRFCNISQQTCKLTGGIELEITVAWSSLVSEKWDISAQGCVL